MDAPQIFAIIPVHNRLEFTRKCLESFAKQTYKNFSLVVVDDGSTDQTYEYISNNYPEWKIIRGNGNWWWTRSMYEGVKYALITAHDKDFILEMNNDCYSDEGFLERILATAKKYPNSIIGSLCVRHNKPTEVVEAGIRFDWSYGLVYGVAQTISKNLKFYEDKDVIGDMDALPGKGTLIPVSIFKKIGNFNFQKLPHYIADYEFTNRARRAGYQLLIDTKARLNHYWEATGIYSTNNLAKRDFKGAMELLFGRRSMNNIVDWLNFLILACPKQYLIKNLKITFWKIFWAMLSIFPFYYLRFFVIPSVKLYQFLQLSTFRLKIKISQFPEHHLKLSAHKLLFKILQFPKFNLERPNN